MNDNPALKGLLVGFSLLATIPLMLLGGVVLSDLWLWFMVPLGVMPIATVHAIGLHCLVSLLTFRISTAELRAEGASGDVLVRTFGVAMAYLFSWGVSAIVASFM